MGASKVIYDQYDKILRENVHYELSIKQGSMFMAVNEFRK